MKRNLKVTISALAVMLVMAIAVTVVSFTLADNENKGELVDEAAFVAATVDTNTNIDNIIENSYATGEEADPIYRIVEIGSGAPSNLKTLVESGGFEEYVINGNKTIDFINIKDASDLDATIEAVMKAECIEYTFFKASDVSDEDADALAAISRADFIYVSNDASSKYSTTNDMGEELYNILHTYAVGDYKPFIIDDIGRTDGPGNGQDDPTTTTYETADVVNNVYEVFGTSYYAYSWDMTAIPEASDYLKKVAGSDYLGIHGDSKAKNWTEVTAKANFTDGVLAEDALTYQMAEVLVITGGTPNMANAIFADLGAPLTDIVDIAQTEVAGEIYDIKTDNKMFYQYGYNARYARPDYIRITEKTVADLEEETMDKYDLIILEADAAGTITQPVYKKLASAMYGRVNIIYAASLSDGTGGSTGSGSTGGNASVQQETNYSELFYMVATNDGQERYENIMVTTKTEFDIIALSESASTCKVIADLINASAYRGNGGPKGSANKFTVLEIQPCYPIDTDLADAQKDYYTVPSDVINGYTKEQLDDGTEYYAWELSKAKIADALNINANQVTLVQMSTEQLAATKDKILGNYDLVYIGGNTSALKEPGEYTAYANMANSAGTQLNNLFSHTVTDKVEAIKKFPIYTMYTHTGEIIITNLSMLAQTSTTVGSVPTAYVQIGDERKASFTVLNGNDISYSKYEQLIEYVDAGMPVIFSSKATSGYRAVKEVGYLQNSIDPDCNMFKFMKYCGELEKPKNVLWGFEEAALVDVDNNGGAYGDTRTGLVKVFDDTEASKIQTLYASSDKRPKLTLVKSPAIYNMYDDNSVIKDKKLSFEYKITGSTNYSVSLYIDDDGNSVFDKNELVATGDEDSLVFDQLEKYFGPLYWKLVVKDKSGQEASTVGISYIANSNKSKQKVRILQIMPGSAGDPGTRNADAGETAQGKNSLYFCTICQQAYERIEYNPSSSSGSRTEYINLYDGHMTDNVGGLSFQGNAGKIYLGLHEHEFGIVKYDSSLKVEDKDIIGADDWDVNLADEVRDKYGFDIEIMMRSEFVEMSTDVANAYDFSDLTDEEKTALTATNPYAKDSDDYKLYEEATVDEKLKVIYDGIYEEKMIAALKEQTELNSLIMYTEEEFDTAFADYQYIDELKLEMNKLSEEQLASVSYNKSVIDAEIELRTAFMHMEDEMTDDFLKKEIHRLLVTRHYWDYYSIGGSLYGYASGYFTNKEAWYTTSYGENINDLYYKYVTLKDNEIIAKEEYKRYSRYLSGEEWLFDSFDMIVIGASDDFANDDFILTTSESSTEKQIFIADSLKFTVKNLRDSNGTALIDASKTFEFTVDKNVAGGELKLYKHHQSWNGYYGTGWGEPAGYTGFEASKDVLNPYGTVVVTGTLYESVQEQGKDQWGNNTTLNNYDTPKVIPNAYMDITIVDPDGKINSSFTVKTDDNGKFNVSIDNYRQTVAKTVKTTEVKDANGNNLPATQALADLEDYLQNNGKVLMFHDTLSYFDDAGSSHLTRMIKKYAAMDRYHSEIDTAATKDLEASNYVPYKSTDPEKYFMTDLSLAGSPYTGSDKYTKWLGENNSYFSNAMGNYYLSNVAYSDTGAVLHNTSGAHEGQTPYKYGELLWAWTAIYARDDQTYLSGKKSGEYGADKASQTNEGIVTLYPFTLSDQLNISFTHGQAYALDLENKNVTVWYSLGGGTGQKEGSSLYAASPNDGMDSYFIYTHENFNYCGAGHTNVTGCGKDNNDERRLYINIICNSVKKSIAEPDIFVYDYDTTENKKYKKSGDGYITKVDNTEDYPEFSFLIRLDEDVDIAKVRIYYDLNFLTDGEDEYTEDDFHKLIVEYDSEQVAESTLTNLFRYGTLLKPMLDKDGKEIPETYEAEDGTVYNSHVTMLKLQPSYFDPYNGQYTYIVIEVIDTEGNPAYKRIKIQLKDKLWNLT